MGPIAPGFTPLARRLLDRRFPHAEIAPALKGVVGRSYRGRIGLNDLEPIFQQLTLAQNSSPIHSSRVGRNEMERSDNRGKVLKPEGMAVFLESVCHSAMVPISVAESRTFYLENSKNYYNLIGRLVIAISRAGGLFPMANSMILEDGRVAVSRLLGGLSLMIRGRGVATIAQGADYSAQGILPHLWDPYDPTQLTMALETDFGGSTLFQNLVPRFHSIAFFAGSLENFPEGKGSRFHLSLSADGRLMDAFQEISLLTSVKDLMERSTI